MTENEYYLQEYISELRSVIADTVAVLDSTIGSLQEDVEDMADEEDEE